MQRRGNFSACCKMLHGKPPERPRFHRNRSYKWMFMKDLWEIYEREVEDLVQFATEGAFCNTFAAARRIREPLARRMEPASVRRCPWEGETCRRPRYSQTPAVRSGGFFRARTFSLERPTRRGSNRFVIGYSVVAWGRPRKAAGSRAWSLPFRFPRSTAECSLRGQ